MNKHLPTLSLWLLAIVSAHADNAAVPPQKLKARPDGTIEGPAFAIPFSTFASEQAKHALLDRIATPSPVIPGDAPKTRRNIDDQYRRTLLPSLQRTFSVSITTHQLGGVSAEVITPAEGAAPRNRSRVLMNLHGGGFQVGSLVGGRVEAIPIAAIGKIKVVTVDYRQGPEHKFPAANEDVVAVYEALLKDYEPQNIGIYGCSAGGILASEAVAWFQARGLPTPGAVGIFGAGAMAYAAGDSIYAGAILSGNAPPAPSAGPISFRHYFGDANLQDALLSPALAPGILRKFPPTLVISGSRDTFLSSALYTHTQLIKAGVDAELHVWEGMGHCFFFQPQLPESREAWNVIVKFFERRLGGRS